MFSCDATSCIAVIPMLWGIDGGILGLLLAFYAVILIYSGWRILIGLVPGS